MRLVCVVATAVLLLTLPAAAAANVELLRAGQASLASVNGDFTIPAPAVSSQPDQLWTFTVSLLESASVTSIDFAGQAFTRTLLRAGNGTRTEVWTLARPDTSNPTAMIIRIAGPTPVVYTRAQFAGVSRTDALITASGQGGSVASNATLTLTPVPRPVDYVVSALTGLSANLSSPSNTPLGTIWGGETGGISVRGVYRGGQTGASSSWSWSRTDPTAPSFYTAVSFALRAPDVAALADVTPSAITQTTASLASSVTGDGGGTVSARGFVYCQGCPTLLVGAPGVTAVASGSGTGAFSGAMSGLTRGTQYTVRAYATNQGGTGYSAAQNVTTSPNRLPTSSAGGPYEITEGQDLALTATASDPDADPLTYAWSLNGGAFDLANIRTPTVAWTTLETRGADVHTAQTVRVRVGDGFDTVTSGPAALIVRNAPPTGVLVAPAAASEGAATAVSFAAVGDPSKADRDAGIRFGYDFDNDGTYDVGGGTYATATVNGNATIPAGALDGPGPRTVRAVLIDKDGGMTTRTATITVGSSAPTATATDVTVDEGGTATIGLTAPTDAAVADRGSLRYAYDLDGDGTYDIGSLAYATATTATTATLPAALTADGPATRPVRMAIVDKDGVGNAYDATVTIANAPPTVAITGPDTAPASGATTLTVTLGDPGTDDVEATVDWGDGTTETLTGTGDVTHTYGSPGAKTVTVVATDSDGARSATVTHTLTVATAPAAPAPTPTPAPPVTPAQARQTITNVAVTPRCVRAAGLRARISQQPTVRVRFRLGIASDATLRIQRLSGKGGAAKCPPSRGADGRRVPGVYSPHTAKRIALRQGTNTLTVAATGPTGKRLLPGTYLLTVEAGGVTARTKFWVLRRP